MNKIKLSSIAAMAQNRVIGKDNTLIWHIPKDLKHFKKTTMGKPIIMGRKSYESLGKPLPGRANIVVSRSFKTLTNTKTPHFDAMESVARDITIKTEEGPFLFSTIDEAIDAAKNIASAKGLDEVFITGGGEIYKQTLPITDRLYLTILDRDYEGDTYFPEFNWNDWNVISEDKHDGDPGFTFYVFEKKI
jgi:dihydrofolate reductase